jgi:hypothetical protein
MLLAAVAQAKDIAVYVEPGGCSIADSEKIISEALIKGAPNVTLVTDKDDAEWVVTCTVETRKREKTALTESRLYGGLKKESWDWVILKAIDIESGKVEHDHLVSTVDNAKKELAYDAKIFAQELFSKLMRRR